MLFSFTHGMVSCVMFIGTSVPITKEAIMLAQTSYRDNCPNEPAEPMVSWYPTPPPRPLAAPPSHAAMQDMDEVAQWAADALMLRVLRGVVG